MPLEVVGLAPEVTVLPPAGAGQVALAWLDQPVADKAAGIGTLSFDVYEGTSSRSRTGTLPGSQLDYNRSISANGRTLSTTLR